MIPEIPYCSHPGRQCQSVVLTKILIHDAICTTHQVGAIMELDVIGCYYRRVNNIILMVLHKLGFPLVSLTCHGLYGPCQGSTCGRLFYLLSYWMVTISIDPSITGVTSHSVCHTIIRSILGKWLGITSKYLSDPSIHDHENSHREVAHTVEHLSSLAQYWERLLFSTGNAINLQKSHWYLMA
jgi:hypothetical protein